MLCCLDALKSIEIILASTSLRRKEILQNIGLQFSSVCPNVDESLPLETFKSTPAYIEALAKLKVDAVVNTLDINQRNCVIIGADTVVCFQGNIFGKPSSHSDAVNILSRLSGNIHQVITGVCLNWISSGKQHKLDQFHEITNVKMTELNHDIIEAYVQSGEPMDKAGAYGIQGLGSSLIERIDGDYFNVVGLPICRLCKYLKVGCEEIVSLN
ncbi:Maf-like protein [Schistosoma japonicum]|uniref:Maf-like protein n=2 Tax=Schistosoma japonicum TaxID=6182 RepID=A0A4Z2DUZ5_SCHJA|nr:Maf-like protein [Schistosoma japonicum]TNN20029.1 Maf-like protein [Schistosoma japonicum]TNN20030.1 Maf-like protein [Schistosoma japonicum]